jgi:hypothetical protein
MTGGETSLPVSCKSGCSFGSLVRTNKKRAITLEFRGKCCCGWTTKFEMFPQSYTAGED